jgi:GNAT superfamily N-acetyltransferase
MNPIRDLGNGLILRRATKEDARALSDFNSRIHSDDGMDQPNERIAAWTRDLLTLPHPTLCPEDFTLIEETSTKRIVSSLNLIPQTWSYEGIEFAVGRPELVGTLPEFRNRGLVRLQFDEIHKWCKERGYVVQAITGIPFYYRQFGYEMALDFVARRFGYEAQVPKLKDGEQEQFYIRPANKDDLPFIAEVYTGAIKRHTIACVRSPEILRYELDGRSEESAMHFEIHIIEDRSGQRLGYLQHPNYLHATSLTAIWYELKQGASWLDVTPSVVRYLWNKGQEYAKRDGRTCISFGFFGGANHPAYEALGDRLPSVREPYAYYLRVPDLQGFLNHIKPALEKRLSKSIAVGHSGVIRLSFYRDGVKLTLDHGQFTGIEPWKPTLPEEGNAAFPGLTFLQLLFGYRSFEELHYAFVDCWWENNDARVLLNALFPKHLSDVFPVA